MNTAGLLPIFLTGLFGSVHCVGMCGGIVGALSAAQAPRPAFPVNVIALRAGPPPAPSLRAPALVLAYNGGRIASYATAGALAGGLAGAAAALSQLAAIETALYWLANLMLIALGLYLCDAWRGLAQLEVAGQRLWSHLRPLMKPLLPMDSPQRAFLLGGLWGWLPCGMVYSVLLTAMLSGSAASGAAVMLAFGLGTLPTLFALGLMGARLRAFGQRRGVRLAAGLTVAGFGALGLLRAAHGMSLGWLDALCLAPQVLP
ncbi:MAG: sulfite exporter TauE/SafE family protein [Pseudomonadota bacterium]